MILMTIKQHEEILILKNVKVVKQNSACVPATMAASEIILKFSVTKPPFTTNQKFRPITAVCLVWGHRQAHGGWALCKGWNHQWRILWCVWQLMWAVSWEFGWLLLRGQCVRLWLPQNMVAAFQGQKSPERARQRLIHYIPPVSRTTNCQKLAPLFWKSHQVPPNFQEGKTMSPYDGGGQISERVDRTGILLWPFLENEI